MREVTLKDMQTILKKNGYVCVRQKGSHQIWENKSNTISLPAVRLKRIVANRLIKENQLII